jgi:hypothetical protein
VPVSVAERLAEFDSSHRGRLTFQALTGSRAGALSAAGNEASGRTNSTIVALNFSGSSTNASCPEWSNHTSLFDGAVSASKYATLVSGGTQ